jgi:hypothetical protein
MAPVKGFEQDVGAKTSFMTFNPSLIKLHNVSSDTVGMHARRRAHHIRCSGLYGRRPCSMLRMGGPIFNSPDTRTEKT